MSNEMNKNSNQHEPPKAVPESKYFVGYGRPPQAHQFKKGQSGNPSGRPKKSGIWCEIGDLLREEVTVTVRGQERQLSLLAAVVSKQCEKALNGDNRSAELVYKKASQLNVLPSVYPVNWEAFEKEDNQDRESDRAHQSASPKNGSAGTE